MAPPTQSTDSYLLPSPEMASCDAHLCSVQIFLTESIQQFLGRHYPLFFNIWFSVTLPWLQITQIHNLSALNWRLSATENWLLASSLQLLAIVIKNSMTLQSFSMNFPLPMLYSVALQAWEMVLLNSITLHDQGTPCRHDLPYGSNSNICFATWLSDIRMCSVHFRLYTV